MTGGVLKKEYYRVHEVARLFDVHNNTIYRWIEDGKLKVHKMPSGFIRISRKTIEKLLEEGPDSPNS